MRNQRWIGKILNSGIFPEQTVSEQRRVRLQNSLIIIGAGVIGFFGLLDIIFGYYETLPNLLLMISIAFINHKLMVRRKYKTAKLLTFWSMLLLASAFSVIAGDEAGSQNVLIPFVIVPIILFQSHKTILLLVAAIVIDFNIVRELQLRIDPIIEVEPHAVEFYLRAAALSYLMIAYGLTAFLKIENERFEKVVINQRDRIEGSYKEITDSMNYARRLQEAILPPMKFIQDHLPDAFILYKPKDIVAGDFYWMETAPLLDSPPNRGEMSEGQRGDVILFAAADCTGHGVPGAIVSVICSNALRKSVTEMGLTEPGRILDVTRTLVIDQFGRSEEEVKDGMDISLCCLTSLPHSEGLGKAMKLQWAGANNPLWIVNPNRTEWPEGAIPFGEDLGGVEVKPNKQPIGKCANPKPFTTHTIELQKGDSIYLFTDGFQDQFGGSKGKKFKSANLKKLLCSVQDKSMKQQLEFVEGAFEQWKEGYEQIDDVCMIGVRV